MTFLDYPLTFEFLRVLQICLVSTALSGPFHIIGPEVL